MLSKGVIQQSTGPYSSSVLLTQRSDRTYRFCMDFRELNHITIRDVFLMQKMEEIFEQLHDAEQMSLIDL